MRPRRARAAVGSAWAAAALLAAAAATGLPDEALGPATRSADARRQRAATIIRAVRELTCDDWILRYRAIRRLAQVRAREAAQPLRKLLTSQAHPWLRGRALVALAEILGQKMLDPALGYAKDRHPALRAAAIEALGFLGRGGTPSARSRRADAVVAAALTDENSDVRCQAVLAIARLRGAEAWPLVQPLFEKDDAALVRHATRALADVATADAHRKLIELLTHDDEQVRAEAVRALARLADSPRRDAEGIDAAVDALLLRTAKDHSSDIRAAAKEALAAYPAGIVRRRMLATLASDQKTLYAAAVDVLAQRPDQQTCDALADLLRRNGLPPAASRYKDPYVRVTAAILDLLSRFAPDRYRDLFIRHLSDSYRTARRSAIKAIGRCKQVDHFALLKDALVDKQDSSSRRYAAQALRDATTGAPPGGILAYLADVFKSNDWGTIRVAIDLLVDRVTPQELQRNLDALAPVLAGENDSYRLHLAKALAKVGTDRTRERIARAQGYVTGWRLIGPWPNDRSNSGLAMPYPPEEEIDFDKTYPAARRGFGAGLRPIRGPKDEAVGLRLTPPQRGRQTLTYLLDLPKRAKLQLAMSLAADRPPDAGEPVDKAAPAAMLSVRAGTRMLLAPRPVPRAAAEEVAVDLAPLAGTRAAVTVVVERPDKAGDKTVLLRRPRVLAGKEALFDLVALAASAVVTLESPGKAAPTLRWQEWTVANTVGTLALHDIFPPPTHLQVAYAAAELNVRPGDPGRRKAPTASTAPAAPGDSRQVHLVIRADDAFAAWLNGREIARRSEDGPARVKVTLRAGANRLLVKVANIRDWWTLSVRVVDDKNRPALP